MPGFAAIGMAVGLSGIGATIGGIAISAAIGAAIGGLSAAVMGGDIGKGMLFGAVGGVVTGGIAGGAIVQGLGVSAMDAGTASIGMMGSAGEAVGGFGHGLATTGLSSTAQAANTAGGLVFGGSMKGNLLTEAVKAGTGPLVKGVGAALLAEDDPGIDIENREDVQAHDREMAKLTSSLRGGGGSSGHAPNYTREVARINAEAAMGRLKHQTAAHTADIKLEGGQSRLTQAQQYKLANQNEQAKFGREWDKPKASAATAGDQVYQSGAGAYDAVLAAQQARGDTGSGRENSALAGPQTGEGYVPSGNFMPGT